MPESRLIGLIRHYCARGHADTLVVRSKSYEGTDEDPLLSATFDEGITPIRRIFDLEPLG